MPLLYFIINALVVFHSVGIDTRIRFSVEPLAGGDAFQQWRDAMRAVARLPLGIPREFRKKVSWGGDRGGSRGLFQ